jgi:hypothetical protein
MPEDKFSARWSLLNKHFLFAELRPEEFEQIMQVATERSYSHGRTIFQRGDPGTGGFRDEAQRAKWFIRQVVVY